LEHSLLQSLGLILYAALCRFFSAHERKIVWPRKIETFTDNIYSGCFILVRYASIYWGKQIGTLVEQFAPKTATFIY
jgi:hypothetical protein